MKSKKIDTLENPYKFLDYYRFEDKDKFFGRKKEIEILFNDITTTRLVVLFAKTGTGKTSLINAGVSPYLKEKGYEPLYIRVEKDPIESIRKVLRAKKLLPIEFEEKPLSIQLENSVLIAQKPIVLFIDQFEEFFIYILNEDTNRAKQFISEVARVYRNPKSGVHFVFSMREEFFVDMDIFRDEIPSIFHYESNLRLKWFDKDQAREVIVGPAQYSNIKVEDKLVAHLIDDLADGDRIEPARLQIICDTLWREKSNNSILLSDYMRLGDVSLILDKRLEDDIDQNLDTEELNLFEKLLPKLSTKNNTKYVRGFDELITALESESSLLRKLIDRLKEIGLVKESMRYKSYYIELTSDYIAERSDYLQLRVKAISLRRILRDAIIKANIVQTKIKEKKSKEKGKQKIKPLTDKEVAALYMEEQNFEKISKGIELLFDLSQEELKFMFIASLEHGGEEKYMKYMELWFDKAYNSDLNIWQILREKIINVETRFTHFMNAVRLLGTIKSKEAIELLSLAIQQGTLSEITLNVISEMKTKEAMNLLKATLKQKELAPQVIEELRRMRTMDAVDILKSALQDEDLMHQAERALEWLSKYGTDQVTFEARSILNKWKHRQETLKVQPRFESSFDKNFLEMEYSGMDESDWDTFLGRIKEGKCTPLIGEGSCSPYLPLGSQIATHLAKKYNYPMPDIDNLNHVAEFISMTRGDFLFPKEIISKILKEQSTPDFISYDLPHQILAELPFPIYLTTSYDDFMIKALKKNGKNAKIEYCRWNKYISKEPANIKNDYIPSVRAPLVYYLNGIWDIPESIILTENDYLDFLVSISENMGSLHHTVVRSLRSTSLIFIGYNREDLSFRTIFRGLINSPERSLRRMSLFVQPPPVEETRQLIDGTIEKLENFINGLGINGVNVVHEVKKSISNLKKLIASYSIHKEKKDVLYQEINNIECQLYKLSLKNIEKKSLVNLINLLQDSIGLLPIENEKKNQYEAIKYLEEYYKQMDSGIYWGTPMQFAMELKRRWEAFIKSE